MMDSARSLDVGTELPMRLETLPLIVCLGLTAYPEIVRAAEARATGKKLIEFGWDEPDTAFLREHIEEMERSPFDGCVFHAHYTKPNGGKGDFMWECWDTRAFKAEELQTALVDLKTTRFRRFTHNFLRFNATPGKVDWFDDFSAITNNARLAAWLAREGKCKGVLFDIEQYVFPLFTYRKQRDAANKSWDEYAAQARKRGREVMNAFQDGYADLTIVWIYSETPRWWSPEGKPIKLPQAYDAAVRRARGAP